MSYKNGERLVSNLDRNNLLEYFINKYSNTGKNIGPVVTDIPGSEVEDYRLVFNDDGTILDESTETHNLDDTEDVDMDSVFESIRRNSSFMILSIV
jgi:hypothetical protein